MAANEVISAGEMLGMQGEGSVDAGASPAAAPALNPEWAAYRDALVAYARADVAMALPGDPRLAVPEALRPGQHHVHHSYIWLGGISATFTVAFVLLLSMASTILSIDFGALPPGMVIMLAAGGAVALFVFALVVALLVRWLMWKNLSYDVGVAEFALHSGILNKKRRHVPYQRVQSVNQTAGVLARLIGVCNVKIDTAGGSANEAIVLPYVRTADAEALRAELFRRKKVLLAGGVLDEFGNAFVGGAVVPSAWMVACASGDERAVRIALGGTAEQAPVASTQVAGTAEGNVLDAADEILKDVRGVFGGDEVATGAVSYEEGMSNKELFFAGLSGAAGHIGVIIAGIIGVAASVAQVFQNNIEEWVVEAIDAAALTGEVPADVSAVAGMADIGGLASALVWQVAIWAVVSVVALWAFSVAATMVRYGGFKVRRRESRIEVEHGLLQRTFHGVDIDRVQSVEIKQSFVRRLIGYCELSVGKIDSMDQSSQDASQAVPRGMVIHPFVKKSRVPEILAGVLPEFADVPVEDVHPPKVALRRAIIRRSIIRSGAFWTFVATALVHVGMEALVVAGALPVEFGPLAIVRSMFVAYYALFLLVITPLNVVGAVLWFRESGMGYNRTFMSMTNGGLSQRTAVFPRKKIQFGGTATNPFQRAAHVATVNARTAAGIGGTTEQLWDVSEHDADRWMEWLRPRTS